MAFKCFDDKKLTKELGLKRTKNPRTLLHNQPIASLKECLKDFNLPTHGNKRDILQKSLFGHILGRQIENPCANTDTTHGVTEEGAVEEVNNSALEYDPDDETVAKQSLVWNKGAWLGLVTNVPDQLLYIGPLTWIW